MRKYILITTFLSVLTMMFYYPIPNELLEKEYLQLEYKKTELEAIDTTKTEQSIVAQKYSTEKIYAELQTQKIVNSVEE